MRLWSLDRTKLWHIRDTCILDALLKKWADRWSESVIFEWREVPEIRLFLLRLWHVENLTRGTRSFRLLLIREANTGTEHVKKEKRQFEGLTLQPLVFSFLWLCLATQERHWGLKSWFKWVKLQLYRKSFSLVDLVLLLPLKSSLLFLAPSAALVSSASLSSALLLWLLVWRPHRCRRWRLLLHLPSEGRWDMNVWTRHFWQQFQPVVELNCRSEHQLCPTFTPWLVQWFLMGNCKSAPIVTFSSGLNCTDGMAQCFSLSSVPSHPSCLVSLNSLSFPVLRYQKLFNCWLFSVRLSFRQEAKWMRFSGWNHRTETDSGTGADLRLCTVCGAHLSGTVVSWAEQAAWVWFCPRALEPQPASAVVWRSGDLIWSGISIKHLELFSGDRQQNVYFHLWPEE